MNTLDHQLLRELLTSARAAVDALDFDEGRPIARRLDYAILNFETKSMIFERAEKFQHAQTLVGDLDSM